MAIEDRIQNTGDSLGKPGNQGNSMQGNRMTGNQDALQMVRGFAPYPHTRCFQTRICADLHGFLGFIALIRVQPVRYVQAISHRVNLCNLWLMRNADSYKFQKPFSDTDLRGFTPGLGLLFYFCRGSSTNRPCFFQNKANFAAGQNSGKLSFDKGL